MIIELRPNRVKRKLATGDIAYIAVGMTDPDDIDAFGPCGFDGVWLEGEHGAVDAANLGNLTRACDIWGLTSIVRVNANDQGLIYRTFDRGAQGVCIPHVNTAADNSTIERHVKAGVRCVLAGTGAWIAEGAAAYIRRGQNARS